jgi:DNA polymerase III alpha subunit
MRIVNFKKVIAPYEGYLSRRFKDHFAQISVDTLLRLKSSIKDVHRVKDGSVSSEIEMICKKLPVPPQGISDHDFVFGYISGEGDEVKGIIETDETLRNYITKFPKHWEIVQKCLGLIRGKSVHACGVVLTDSPVSNFIPTTKIGSCKNPVTQYTSSFVEQAGAIKYDMLGVNSLKDIQGCIKLIQNKAGYTPKDEKINGLRVPGLRVIPHIEKSKTYLYDIWDLPEDPKVFYDICSGDTATVFQFSTPSARQWLKEFFIEGVPYLNSIMDLSTFTALDRPGPLEAIIEENGIRRNILQEYAARARGETPIAPNSTLDSLLPKTYGLACYQEDVQKVFQIVGQTTPEEADEFRIHVGKKKLSEISKDRAIFLPGAIKTLGSEEEAERIFGQMASFGKYAFNRSHAVCYAYTGYVCAWLKHYYPLEWWVSVLNNADRNEIDETFWRHVGHLVDPPDLKLSQESWSIQGDRIRAPLSFLKGVGETAHKELTEIRPFTDIIDFYKKIYDRKVKLGSEKITEKTNKKTGEKSATKQFKLGRSSLTKTLLNKFVVSGVADSLFPEDCQSIFDKLSLLSKVRAEIEGKKEEKVDLVFINLTPIQRYQLRKSILPTFSLDLAPLVANLMSDHEFMFRDSHYIWLLPTGFNPSINDWGRSNKDGDIECPIVKGRLCRRILDKEIIDISPKFKFGVVAYIQSIKKFWENKALRINFEVDGERFEAVKWPSKKQKEKNENAKIPEGIEGGVAILTLSRWAADKDFCIDDIRMVAPALNLKEEKDELYY